MVKREETLKKVLHKYKVKMYNYTRNLSVIFKIKRGIKYEKWIIKENNSNYYSWGFKYYGCRLWKYSSSNGESKDKLTQIKEAGKLVVGMSADYAPYEYHALIDGKDQIVGFDVDIAQAIADDIGVELELKEMNFDSLCESVQLGKIDMTISGMTPKPDRTKAVDFSDIYYKAEQGFLIQASNKDKYKSLSDLEGKKVGAQFWINPSRYSFRNKRCRC